MTSGVVCPEAGSLDRRDGQRVLYRRWQPQPSAANQELPEPRFFPATPALTRATLHLRATGTPHIAAVVKQEFNFKCRIILVNLGDRGTIVRRSRLWFADIDVCSRHGRNRQILRTTNPALLNDVLGQQANHVPDRFKNLVRRHGGKLGIGQDACAMQPMLNTRTDPLDTLEVIGIWQRDTFRFDIRADAARI